MHIIEGLVIYPGLIMGRARKREPISWDLPSTHIAASSLTTEIQSFEEAVSSLAQTIKLQLEELKDSEEEQAILHSHLLILQDPELVSQVKDYISQNLVSAPFAIQLVSIPSRISSNTEDRIKDRRTNFKELIIQNNLGAHINIYAYYQITQKLP